MGLNEQRGGETLFTQLVLTPCLLAVIHSLHCQPHEINQESPNPIKISLIYYGSLGWILRVSGALYNILKVFDIVLSSL